MPRIIRDSDDEGDFGSLSPVSQHALSPPSGNQPSKYALTVREEELSVSSASSTDIVRLEVAGAHRNVAQKNPALNEEPSSVETVPGRLKSPAVSRKRRLSMSSFDYGQSPPRTIERRKTVRTYGSSNQRKHNLYDEQNSAFEAMREQEQGTQSSCEKTPNDLAGQGERADKHGNGEDMTESPSTWRMPETIVDDFARHEPQMFADFLSTIPDATMTQQRLVEAALAERGLSECNEALVRQRTLERPSDNFSVAWSDWLHSSEIRRPPDEQSIEQPPTHASGSSSVSHEYQSALPETSHRAKSIECQPTGSEISTAQSKGLRRTKTTNNASSLQSSRRDDSADELSFPTHEPTKSQKRKAPAAKSNNISNENIDTDSAKRSRNRPVLIDDSDSDDVTLEMSRHEQGEGDLTETQQAVEESVKEFIRAVRTPKEPKTKENRNSDALNSDDIAIGLPKERYKPRPSRSRSSRLALDESVDYSVRPEKAAKERAKRRKTTDGATAGRSGLSLNDKVERMVEMGFSPTKSKDVLQCHDEDLDVATQALLSPVNGVRTRGEKDFQLAHTPVDAPTAPTPSKLVRVEIPLPKLTIEEPPIEPPQPKRKRGRPSKNKHASNTEVTEQLHDGAQKLSRSSDPISHDKVDELQEHTPQEHSLLGMESASAKAEEAGEKCPEEPCLGSGSPTAKSLRAGSQQPPKSSEAEQRVEPVEKPRDEPKPKKRGRGRPRSTQKINDAYEGSATINSSTPGHAEESQKATEDTAIKDVSVNTKDGEQQEGLPPSTPPNLLTAKADDPRSSARHDASDKAQMPQKKPIGTGTGTQHSPLGKGMVPYRVGLSRKARIAPLLRIVRK